MRIFMTRVRRIGGVRRRVYGPAVALLVTLFAFSCDPCAGTLSCSTTPAVNIVGQILDEETAKGVDGASVEFRRTGGASLSLDTAVGHTRAGGVFLLELPATADGSVIGTMRVAPPSGPAYEVTGLSLKVTRRSGEATVLPPWSSAQPTFPYVFQFVLAGTQDQRIADASVEFHRTGGVALVSGNQPVDTVRGTTDPSGWVRLLYGVRAGITEDVVGDLLIHVPSRAAPTIVRDVRVRAQQGYRPPIGLIHVDVP